VKKISRTPKKPIVNLQSETISSSSARTCLARLLKKASEGETVHIVRGHRRFVLREVPPIEPIPMRPPGYFALLYTNAEIEEENRLAKASVIRSPDDLE